MMQAKKKLCDGCDRLKPIWKNHEGKRYCKFCWSAHKPADKTAKKISPRSSKLKSEDRIYTRLRGVFLDDHPMCEAKIPGCTLKSTDVHHKKGRGIYYLDPSTWLSVCRQCHDWIDANPQEALEAGFSERRF